MLQKNGHPIVLWWVPAHLGLMGNKKANLAARNRAQRRKKQAERLSSLAYIKMNQIHARSTELTRWHKRKTQEREASHCGHYIPWTKNNINPVLENAPKKYASQYYQLKVGHGAVRTFLAKIGVIEHLSACGVMNRCNWLSIYTLNAADGEKNEES